MSFLSWFALVVECVSVISGWLTIIYKYERLDRPSCAVYCSGDDLPRLPVFHVLSGLCGLAFHGALLLTMSELENIAFLPLSASVVWIPYQLALAVNCVKVRNMFRVLVFNGIGKAEWFTSQTWRMLLNVSLVLAMLGSFIPVFRLPTCSKIHHRACGCVTATFYIRYSIHDSSGLWFV